MPKKVVICLPNAPGGLFLFAVAPKTRLKASKTCLNPPKTQATPMKNKAFSLK